MSQLNTILSNFGLSEKESKVFLSLVKLGASTASAIAQDSGITRTLVYDLAENLKQKGLISETIEKGVKKYEAVSHAGLVAVIARKKKELDKLENKAQRTSGEFAALEQGRQQRTLARFFIGIEGVESVYDEALHDIKKQKENNKVFTIFSPENLEKLIPGWSERKEYFDMPHIEMRHIMSESKSANHYIEQMKRYGNHTYKIWRRIYGQFPTDTLCWNDKIAYIDLSDYPSGIIIKNKAIADTFKMWFEKMWKDL